jgi:hypothetical protein
VASLNYANHSALPGKEKAQMMNATCGAKCYEQFKRLNPNMSSQKMSLVSRILMADWYSSRCALTWKMKGTKFSRLLFQLQPKTHRTEEIDVGLLLPTPKAMEAPSASWENRKPNSKFKPGVTLTDLKVWGMLPTPKAREAPDCLSERKRHTPSMESLAVMGMLPTPNTCDAKTANNKDNHDVKRGYLRGFASMGMLPTPQAQEGEKITGLENQDSMTKRVRQITGKTSQLNPRFVAEMMGFPPNWTELPFQSGEQNQSKDMEMP